MMGGRPHHQAGPSPRSSAGQPEHAVELDAQVVAAVERKSLPDLVSSLTTGRLRYALAELASLPHAVVVEDRYSRLFDLEHIRPAVAADALAEVQIRWPSVPIVFCETRPLAEEWTYRYLAAALNAPTRSFRPKRGQARDAIERRFLAD